MGREWQPKDDWLHYHAILNTKSAEQATPSI
jgi:hypothetical protein